MTATRHAQIARQLADAFVSKKRDNGESFTVLTDDRPEWMQEAVREAHDDEMPNDWVYASCDSAAWYIARALEGADGIPASDLDPHEWCDSNVDVYNADRLTWLSADLYRAGYVNDAVSELGWPDSIFAAIGYGQYEQSRTIFGALCSAIDRQAEAETEDAD